jgi:hypothetical protein
MGPNTDRPLPPAKTRRTTAPAVRLATFIGALKTGFGR